MEKVSCSRVMNVVIGKQVFKKEKKPTLRIYSASSVPSKPAPGSRSMVVAAGSLDCRSPLMSMSITPLVCLRRRAGPVLWSEKPKSPLVFVTRILGEGKIKLNRGLGQRQVRINLGQRGRSCRDCQGCWGLRRVSVEILQVCAFKVRLRLCVAA